MSEQKDNTGSPVNLQADIVAEAGSGVANSLEEIMADFREFCLSLRGNEAVEMQGWLIGVMVRLERHNEMPPKATDDLLAELRASTGPPDAAVQSLADIDKTQKNAQGEKGKIENAD